MSAKSVAGSPPPRTGQQPPKRVTPVPAAWRNKRKWVMLAVDYMDSAKLIRAGQDGELMFVRMVARCGGRLSDGYLEVAYVLRLCADLRGGPEAALESIRREGLVTVEDGMVHLIGYLDHQISSAQINGALEADAARKAAATAEYKARQAAASGVAPVAPVADDADVDASSAAGGVTGKPGQAGFNPAVDSACEYLADRVDAMGWTRPDVTNAWRVDMTFVLEKLGDLPVNTVVDAALADTFQRQHAHEPSYFRKHLSKLVMLTRATPKVVKGGGMAVDDLAGVRRHEPRRPTTVPAVA